jgi:oxygen-independent coproporphyrinogen-3 oxidase
MSAGVYIHIPFCKSRCSYCDFATDVYRTGDAVERYVEALCGEIGRYAHTGGNATVRERAPTRPSRLVARFREDRPDGTLAHTRVSARIQVDTIYFGGGTPSLLTAGQVERILDEVQRKFSVDAASEVTMEMNPATVTPETLREYRTLGVNRASFGVQTFDDTELKRLARGHDAQDARDTFKMLRGAGFDNISFDLIAGLPRQTLQDWERNLDEALKLDPEHLSLYLLEIHQGTPLAEQIRSERQPMPDEVLAAAMYELMVDRVAAAGFRQYEISNFAKPGFESRHNTKYWRLDPVYGFGVSAHSFDGHERYANERDTAAYVRRIEESSTAEISRETIDAASEFIFLGLRLRDGVDLAEYKTRFGRDLLGENADEIERLIDAGLIEHTNARLRLTRRGMLFSNEVFQAFV